MGVLFSETKKRSIRCSCGDPAGRFIGLAEVSNVNCMCLHEWCKTQRYQITVTYHVSLWLETDVCEESRDVVV